MSWIFFHREWNRDASEKRECGFVWGKNHLLPKEIYGLPHKEYFGKLGMDLNCFMVIKKNKKINKENASSNNLLILWSGSNASTTSTIVGNDTSAGENPFDIFYVLILLLTPPLQW